MLMKIIHQVNDFFFRLFLHVSNIKDSNPNKKQCIISSITGKRFSGNQVLAYYYVSWTLAMPEQVQHLGLDFKKEYEMAKMMSKS
jgi:hypothetical protein